MRRFRTGGEGGRMISRGVNKRFPIMDIRQTNRTTLKITILSEREEVMNVYISKKRHLKYVCDNLRCKQELCVHTVSILHHYCGVSRDDMSEIKSMDWDVVWVCALSNYELLTRLSNRKDIGVEKGHCGICLRSLDESDGEEEKEKGKEKEDEGVVPVSIPFAGHQKTTTIDMTIDLTGSSDCEIETEKRKPNLRGKRKDYSIYFDLTEDQDDLDEIVEEEEGEEVHETPETIDDSDDDDGDDSKDDSDSDSDSDEVEEEEEDDDGEREIYPERLWKCFNCGNEAHLLPCIATAFQMKMRCPYCRFKIYRFLRNPTTSKL